jgi:O-antigen/teichoic acid export membrane protein
VSREPSSSVRIACILLAEALFVPTGLLTAAFLTRRLGPEGYGLFTLSAALIAWIEWSLASLFSRATIQVVSGAEDWRPAGAALTSLHGAVGTAAALLLCVLADPIAARLHEPALAGHLRLFALDIPLFCLAQAHRSLLTGLGRFTHRAAAGAGRWTARFLLILLLVERGLSVPGAILGCIGASLVELAVGRAYVRPALFARSGFALRGLWEYAWPLLLSAVSLRLYEKTDLFVLKLLGATAAQAGQYGAAQNLALLPGLLALSLSPMLLASATRALRRGEDERARRLGRDGMRGVIALLPATAAVAGAAPQIVDWIYGTAFRPAAPVLALLLFGAWASLMLSVVTALLTAAGRPIWTFGLTGPLVPLALAGHAVVIPHWGLPGAAVVTATDAILAAVAGVLLLQRLWGLSFPLLTLWRSLLLGAPAYLLAAHWATPGPFLLLTLPAIALFSALGLALLGESGAGELARLRAGGSSPGCAGERGPGNDAGAEYRSSAPRAHSRAPISECTPTGGARWRD